MNPDNPSPLIDIAPELAAALRNGQPTVALESTIIAQGMAYPENLATARAVEAIARAGGAIPATIAIIGGRAKVGLSAAELEFIAGEPGIAKASSRDIPFLMATAGHGATTVAATIRIASLAGIRVMVTGGIGGVHRGAGQSFDLSADLHELARHGVAVVSAGAKSILDIGATLEMLETLSVPVVVFGADRFPSFYSRDSGQQAPARLDNPRAIARMMRAKWRMVDEGGILIANPIAADDEVPAAEIEQAIAAAEREMAAAGIAGKDATPFMLAKINELTAGRSLQANIALIKSNARLGAAIAVAYATPD
ncbi:MAG: pseudouridine-5'-phosphate glycosidase [Dongiaceae bacterium]